MRDEKFMADRAAAREKQKAEKEESRIIIMKARASRRRARIEQRKAELKAKRVHAKEVSMLHAALCENYTHLVRLDKIKQTKKEESKYKFLRNAIRSNHREHHHDSHLDGKHDDMAVRKHITKQTQKNFSSRRYANDGPYILLQVENCFCFRSQALCALIVANPWQFSKNLLPTWGEKVASREFPK